MEYNVTIKHVNFKNNNIPLIEIKEYLTNRNITQADLMRKHNISANTLRKYIRIIKEKK